MLPILLALVAIAAYASFGRPATRPGSGGHKQMPRAYYRTKDGQADYRFSFERGGDGNYYAYIESQPSYGSRDASLHATHRLRDGARYYVCWTNTLRSEAEARQVSALWADKTQEYIRTGARF